MTAKKTTKSAPAPKKAATPKKPKASKNAAPPAEEPTKTPEATTPTTSADTKPAKTKKVRSAKPKKMSALDAAAKVLAEAGEPMNTKTLIEAMATKGYWTSPGGKTPHATLYAAILREIGTKKTDARFRKTSKGHFSATKGA
ncbi:MAG: winged helix-turn-helix domain-containing protein [Gemmataceae bacterium]|nr:winged helix-turn-helix domain-containing protein [Gemmataceae bacterium]